MSTLSKVSTSPVLGFIDKPYVTNVFQLKPCNISGIKLNMQFWKIEINELKNDNIDDIDDWWDIENKNKMKQL